MQPAAEASPEPFRLEGGDVGVLLLHGFTGSPAEMRHVGRVLHHQGLTVHGPLLPGHGTCVTDLNTCRWHDWTDAAEAAFDALGSRCSQVFVGGLSMGSLLSLWLAVHRPALAGAIAYAPAVKVADWRIALTPLLRHLVSMQPKRPGTDLFDPEAPGRLWSYDRYPVGGAAEVWALQRRVRRLLSRVRCPLLVVSSDADRSVHPDSARITLDEVGSREKDHLRLERSGHALTIDGEWERVAERTLEFVRSHQT